VEGLLLPRQEKTAGAAGGFWVALRACYFECAFASPAASSSENQKVAKVMTERGRMVGECSTRPLLTPGFDACISTQ
jgi:hypothetical protein